MSSPIKVGSPRAESTPTVTAYPARTTAGGIVLLVAELPPADDEAHKGPYDVRWVVQGPVQLSAQNAQVALLGATSVTGDQVTLQDKVTSEIRATLDTGPLAVGPWTVGIILTPTKESKAVHTLTGEADPIHVLPRPFAAGDDVAVTLKRTAVSPTSDQALWIAIRNNTNALGFDNYSRFMDLVMGGDWPGQSPTRAGLNGSRRTLNKVERRTALPFPNVDRYRLLKAATEVFLMINCGIDHDGFKDLDLEAESRRLNRTVQPGDIEAQWRDYLTRVPAGNGDYLDVIPYLGLIRMKLRDVAVVGFGGDDESAETCYGILADKLVNPCYLELIWSYWTEESGLVQTMNAISRRFQNRAPAYPGRDPLAGLDIDPLRPLNNVFWGWVQDAQHQLTTIRRAYEYDHQYGLALASHPARPVRGADSRSRFIEAFHHLLAQCAEFYSCDDDTTVIADGFNVLNALKETHLLLTQGAHNQYGDLPWTARHEMLMSQWILSRPEMRDFLPSRTMVAYPEPWMERVEGMNRLQGWSDTSVLHFRDLAVFGEQLLLGIRFGAWAAAIEPEQAANWARYVRAEVRQYSHAYRAVTGVDLNHRADPTIPAFHLRRRHGAYRT